MQKTLNLILEKLTLIGEQNSNIQKTLDRKIADDEDVIAEYQQVNIRLGTIEAVVDELRKVISSLPRKTQDRVIEANLPLIESTSNLKKVIKEKEVIAMDTQKIKEKSYWRKFISWFTHGLVS